MKLNKVHYTKEKNALILIQLLKMHNIRNIIVSPGSTNICFVASVQDDDFFKIYSCVDERSAAYMACGLAAETKEPVVISCTGATASRNYMPALTEAFYRNLPILAVTSCQPRERIGQYIPQVLDRSCVPKDVVKRSFYVESVFNEEKEWAAVTEINTALIELKRNGGGPVHIDLETNYTPDFTIEHLPNIRVINHYNTEDILPSIPGGNIAVFIGNHEKWTDDLTKNVETFCERYGAVVLCDHTSNYWGKYRVMPNIICSQRGYRAECLKVDLLIHIGQVSGAYMQLYPQEVWRVNPDGEVRDVFKKLTKVFQMSEKFFFGHYVTEDCPVYSNGYYQMWKREIEETYNLVTDLPFSNAWIAQYSATKVPENAVIHFGILNSLRSWNFFETTKGTLGYCNTGGFGIDGCVSTLVGASLANSKRLYFGVVGDLAFFYDLNSLGNRHIKNNIRLIVINNGKGNEFRNYGNWGAPLGDAADDYICAAGHYANKSTSLVKNYAQDLGFRYMSAHNKVEFEAVSDVFWNPNLYEKPVLLEVFTETKDESNALEIIYNLRKYAGSSAKDIAKSILGENSIRKIKSIIRK